MHYKQQQLKYAALHFQPVFLKLFFKLPISEQNYQGFVYQINQGFVSLNFYCNRNAIIANNQQNSILLKFCIIAIEFEK